MILMDNETTKLNEMSLASLEVQPYITEFCAIKVDDETLEELDVLTFFCKPPIPISPEAVKITGITNEMLAKEKPFIAYYPKVTEFFLGEKFMVAHNLAFDRDVLKHELTRIDKLFNFPWPPTHYCTVELNTDITGKYMSLVNLYEHLFKEKPPVAHRAEDDVRSMLRIVRWMREVGKL